MPRGFDDGLLGAQSGGGADLVVAVDHHQRVVHHHAAQGHHAEDGDEREIVAEQVVADHGARGAARDAGEDDERLRVAAQLRGDEHEDHQQRHQGQIAERRHVLRLLAAEAGLADLQARVALLERWQHIVFQQRGDFRGRGQFGVHLRLDGDDAQAVDAVDGGEAARFRHLRHRGERRQRAVGKAHPGVEQVAGAAPLFVRVAHHHLHFAAATLDALHFVAEEVPPQLPGDVERRQASRFASRGEFDVVLALAEADGVLDFVERGHLRVGGLQVGHGAVEQVVVGMREVVFHVRSRAEELGDVGKAFGAGELAGVAAPAAFEFLRRERALRFAVEDHLHGGDMAGDAQARFARSVAIDRSPADGDAHRAERRAAGLFVGGVGRVHQAFRGGPGDLERRAHGELQVRLQAVRFQAGEEQKADFVGRQQRRRGDQQRHPAAEGHEAVAHGPGDGRHQRLVAEALHRGADLRLADIERPAAPRPAVGKVRRQDEEHLHQRHGEHGDHHHRHDAQNLAEGAGDEQQRREGRHRRQHADGHRRAHAQAAGDGAVDAAQPALLLGDNVLADHHRVVDNYSQHDDQGEQRHHVEVDVEEVEEQEGAQERNRHAHRHPHGEPQVQHHHQEQEHQREAEDAVAQQQAEAALQHFGAVFPDFHVDAGQRLVVREHRLDLRGDGEQVLGLGLLHAHEDAAAVVVGVDQFDVDEPVAHGGDVAQA